MLSELSLPIKSQSMHHHQFKARPMPQAAPAEITPTAIVQKQLQYHLVIVMIDLEKPRTRRKKNVRIPDMRMQTSFQGNRAPFATRSGRRGIRPKIAKEKKVTTQLIKGVYSSAMMPSSSTNITLRNPSGFLARISTISQESFSSIPSSLQIVTISLFSASQSFQISFCSLFFSISMYSESLLVATKSAMAIDSASTIKELTPMATMISMPVPPPNPDRAIMNVVITPSSPPYTADFTNSPTLTWVSTCSSLGTLASSRSGMSPSGALIFTADSSTCGRTNSSPGCMATIIITHQANVNPLRKGVIISTHQPLSL